MNVLPYFSARLCADFHCINLLLAFRVACCTTTNIVGNTNLEKGNSISQFTFYVLIVNIELKSLRLIFKTFQLFYVLIFVIEVIYHIGNTLIASIIYYVALFVYYLEKNNYC